LACVADSTVTLVTFALAVAASPPAACDWMTEAKTWPSWSRLIRVATGVFGLKNSVQLAAMSFAAELPAAADGDADAAEGDAEVGAADGLGAELLAAELPLPLLPQAARPAPTAQARTIWESSL
jgi:hypothetical protein